MKTYQKILIWGAAAIVLIIIGIQMYISIFLEPRLKERLSEEIHRASDGAYSLHLDELDLKLFRRSAHLSGISLLSEQNENLQATARRLNIRGVRLLTLGRRNGLIAGSIELENPTVHFVQRRNRSSASGSTDPGRLSDRVAAAILEEVEKLEVGEITITGMKLNLMETPDAEPYLSFNRSELALHDLLVDSSTVSKPELVPVAGLDLILRHLNYHTANDLYAITSQKAEFSTRNGSAIISGMTVQPRLKPDAFFEKVGHATDRIELEIASFRLRKVDTDALNRYEKMEADSVRIRRADLRVFRDKHYPEKEDKPPKNLPQQMLREIGFPVAFHIVEIEDSFIRYKEHEDQAPEPGEVDFSSLYATLSNVTNIESRMDQEMVLETKALVMNRALLNARFTFPLRENSHTIEGSMERMDATVLNRAFEPLASARIDDGRILDLTFSMHLAEQQATGEVRLLYEDLTITLVKRESGDENLITQVGSFLANTFAIQSNNNNRENPRIGQVDFERDIEKSVFNYWWKSLQSGLQTSIGL